MKNRTAAAKLHELLKERILVSGGAIPFSEYMEICLYEPDMGYYMQEKRKLGKEGDYYTSAFLGRVMGQCLANKLAETYRRFAGREVSVIEWGGGDGRLASHMLDELRSEHAEVYAGIQWFSAESSPYHRKLQAERLRFHRERIAAIAAPGHPLIETALASGVCLLVANELLDAFPVHRLRWIRGAWREIYVGWNEEAGRFQEVTGGEPEGEISALLEGLSGREGQYIEVNLRALEWIRAIGRRMRRGMMLLIDYGGTTAELIAPHRMRGTLMTYRRHQADDDPYEAPGEKDLTAHVNFEWCVEAGREAGFQEARLMTKREFLVGQGVLAKLRSHDGTDPFGEAARNNRAIRQLLFGDGWGDTFKVLEMYK